VLDTCAAQMDTVLSEVAVCAPLDANRSRAATKLYRCYTAVLEDTDCGEADALDAIQAGLRACEGDTGAALD